MDSLIMIRIGSNRGLLEIKGQRHIDWIFTDRERLDSDHEGQEHAYKFGSVHL